MTALALLDVTSRPYHFLVALWAAMRFGRVCRDSRKMPHGLDEDSSSRVCVWATELTKGAVGLHDTCTRHGKGIAQPTRNQPERSIIPAMHCIDASRRAAQSAAQRATIAVRPL